MSDVKWLKIVTDIFDDEKMLLIESLPSSDSIIVIWFKLLCLAGKNNNSGVFFLNDRIAYNEEMLATIFRREINTVRLALKTFETYGMIQIINNVITIPNWDKHQQLDSIEKRRERQKIYMQERRNTQKLLAEGNEICKANSKANSKTNGKANSKANVSSLEGDKKEIRIDKIRVDIYIDKWNSLGLTKIISIKNQRLTHLKARVEEFSEDQVIQAIDNINLSKFLKGINDRGWTIDFDWLLKPNNFTKVLEGNYTDKKGVANKNVNPKTAAFVNFDGRQYTDTEYEDLENKLLGWDNDES